MVDTRKSGPLRAYSKFTLQGGKAQHYWTGALPFDGYEWNYLVELAGIEPAASSLRTMRSPS
jgi:hypothetical protein